MGQRVVGRRAIGQHDLGEPFRVLGVDGAGDGDTDSDQAAERGLDLLQVGDQGALARGDLEPRLNPLAEEQHDGDRHLAGRVRIL